MDIDIGLVITIIEEEKKVISQLECALITTILLNVVTPITIIHKSGNPENRISRNQNSQKSEYPEIRISRNQNIKKSEYQEIKISRNQNIQKSGNPEMSRINISAMIIKWQLSISQGLYNGLTETAGHYYILPDQSHSTSNTKKLRAI